MLSTLTSPTVTAIVIKNVQTALRTTIFANSTQALQRWIARICHQPTLGEILAAGDMGASGLHRADTLWWLTLLQPPSKDQLARDFTAFDKRTIDLHLYVALGSLGLSAVGMLGVPVLILVTVPAQAYFVARFVQDGIKQVFGQHRVGLATIDALVTTTLLSLGYFWAVALYASLFYWSRRMLGQTGNRYHDSLWLTASVLPRRVRVLRNASETWIDLDTLDVHDTIIIYAGEVLPVDGIVVAGSGKIDQQALTGEAAPVERSVGEHVFATTLLRAGSIQICTDQPGTNTLAARIENLQQDMRNYTASLMLRTEAIADRYAVPLLLLSGGTLLLLGPTSALAALCSYLGASLSVTGPITVLNYLHLAAQRQILVQDEIALGTLRTVDTVIFDKTGTLTQDPPHVVNIYAYANYAEDDVLRFAAAAEQHQVHPIARAIQQVAHEHCIALLSVSDESYEPGVGVHCQIAQSPVHVVGISFLEQAGIRLPFCAESIQAYCYQHGHSLVHVVLDNLVIGTIELAANLHPDAQQVVAGLQHLGKNVVIASSDHEQPVCWLAQRLQVDTYYASLLPSDKVDLIARLQRQGKTVCFVGDGLNDALALKQADVSISMQGTLGLVRDPAQILLLNSDLMQLLPLFDLAQSMHVSMQGNKICSIVPGVITISGVYLFHFGILAASMLYSTGFGAGIINAMLPLILSSESP